MMDIAKCTACGADCYSVEPVMSSLDKDGKATKVQCVCIKCGHREVKPIKQYL